jgi:hypothetical protein
MKANLCFTKKEGDVQNRSLDLVRAGNFVKGASG